VIRDFHIEEIFTSLSAFEIYKKFFFTENSFILDSSMPESELSKFSIIGFDPFLRLESKGDRITLSRGRLSEIYFGNPLDRLSELLSRYRFRNDTKLPIIGGAIGYFAYDLCHHIEKLPKNAVDDIKLPDMALGFYDTFVIVDHLVNKTFVVSLIFSEDETNTAVLKAREIKALIESAKSKEHILGKNISTHKANPLSNFTPDEYYKIVERAREYIHDGDIYQVNLSQRFETDIQVSPILLYEGLRNLNPAPFAAFLNFAGYSVLSSSPERFLSLEGTQLETRPIKGTWPRGRDKSEDETNKQLLKNSVKDKAENLMIVDLMRNDIGKVCKIGSVNVTDLFAVESYATVHHLVSTVTGELRDGLDAVDCIKATFPGGSITGAPKIRAMQIIDELEPTCRSIYTGSIGYIGFDGSMDINIAIRTIIIKGRKAYYQVGGGIVWDSVPQTEYEETLHKGRSLYNAINSIGR